MKIGFLFFFIILKSIIIIIFFLLLSCVSVEKRTNYALNIAAQNNFKSFTNCNQNDGCKSMGILSNDNLEKMRKGKTLSVITRSYGSPQNIKIDFPLKDFDSEFKKI